MIEMLIQGGLIHYEYRIGYRDRRRRLAAVGMQGERLIRHFNGAGGDGGGVLFAAYLYLLVNYGEIAAGVEFLDFVPVKCDVSQGIGMESHFAADLIDELTVQR